MSSCRSEMDAVYIANKEETRGSRDEVMEFEWVDVMENSEP
jgi:hypothetical protein